MKKNNLTQKIIFNYIAPSVLIASVFFISSLVKKSFFEKENKKIMAQEEIEDSLINLNYLQTKIDLAKELVTSGKIEQAIEYYKTLLQYEQTFSILNFNIAKLYSKSKKYKMAEHYFKKSIEQNPKNTNAYTHLGVMLRDAKMYAESAKQLKIATKIAPNYFDAHLQLGKTYHEMGNFEKAIKYSKKARDISPKSIYPYLNMAYTHNKNGDLEKSITLYQKVIKMDPHCANAHYNLGYTLKILGKLEEALEPLDKALELNPDYLDAHIARSQTKIALEKFDEGWEEYEWRWGLFGIDPKKYKNEMWNGSDDITGKTILLRTEQGLGDTMQFVRFAKTLKDMGAKKVICKVQKPLFKLLSNCDFIDQVIYDMSNAPKHDLHAQMMSMPRILKIQPNTIPSEIPYFKADEKLETEWAKKLSKDKNFKVGLCWHVDPVHEKDKSPWSIRSVDLEQLKPFAKIKNVTFYSLQKLDDHKQLANIPEGINLQNFGPDFDRKNGSFMDSAAIIKSLDLVITVDTCIAHLAGALGKPVWMLLPYSPDCRWYLKKDKTPWYPTMTLFRQSKPQQWDNVIENIALALSNKIEEQIKL